MAYVLYIAVKEGVIQLTDSTDNIPFDRFPHDKIKKAIATDSLKLYSNMIKLFLVRRECDYAIYLAKTQKEVARLHDQIFRERAYNVVDMTHKKDTSIYDEQAKKYKSFREIQKDTVKYPSFVCLIDRKKA